jgi:hypothetical protein
VRRSIHSRHHPPPGRRLAPPDDRLQRVTQYAAASRFDRRLWNTGSPGQSRATTGMWVARQHANELPSIQISNSPACADTASRSRGRIRPSFILKIPPSSIRGRRECRAPDAPAAACAMVVVERTRVSQVTPESPGIPRAMVLTVSFVLSPGTGLSCPRRLRTCIRKLDTSVGVSGPHDFSVRLSALRPKAHPRPPHPAPRW